MKHYVKNLWSVPTQGFECVPDFVGQREQIVCPCCNRTVTLAVPQTGIDWELVANSYKRYAEKLQRRFGEICRKVEAEHFTNPAAEVFQREIEEMIERLKREMGDEDSPK